MAVLVPDKVDDLEEAHQAILNEAAACSGGSVVIDDIELVEDEDGRQSLHFRRDGRSYWWELEHQSPWYVDLNAIDANFGDLAPNGNDRREFFHIEHEEGSPDGWYLLITSSQAQALRDEFGIPVAEQGHSGTSTNVLVAEPEALGWSPYDDLPVIQPNTPDAFEEIAAPLHVLKLFVSEPEPGSLGYNMGVIEDAVDRYQKALRARTR